MCGWKNKQKRGDSFHPRASQGDFLDVLCVEFGCQKRRKVVLVVEKHRIAHTLWILTELVAVAVSRSQF